MALPPLTGARRWSIALADISLLIACAMLLTPAGDGAAVAARVPALNMPVAQLFEPGEAVLRSGASARLHRLTPGRYAISVGSAGAASARLDAWELAAARTAALARTLGPRAVLLEAPTHDARVRLTPLSPNVVSPTGTSLAAR